MAPLAPLALLDIDSLIGDEDARSATPSARSSTTGSGRRSPAGTSAADVPVRDLALEFGKLGLLGMHLTGYGCAGTSATAYGLACLELEAGDSGLRSIVSVQGSLAMFAIWKHGSDEQKDAWLPRMATGEAIGCFGLTEPDFGSDPGGMRTRARRDGSDWVLTATRCGSPTARSPTSRWSGRAPSSRRGRADPRLRRARRTAPGFSAPEIKQKMSLRASVTSELVLDDVRLPADAMLPGREGLPGRCPA